MRLLAGFVLTRDEVRRRDRWSRAQLVARIETQLRLRDAWLAELHAVRSAELLGKVCRGPRRPLTARRVTVTSRWPN